MKATEIKERIENDLFNGAFAGFKSMNHMLEVCKRLQELEDILAAHGWLNPHETTQTTQESL